MEVRRKYLEKNAKTEWRSGSVVGREEKTLFGAVKAR